MDALLLIGELAYGDGSNRDEHAKIAVLAGSLLSALLAARVLRIRNRHYAWTDRHETEDLNGNRTPDSCDQSTDDTPTA
ncbi:MAG TPA: hypothetical protein VGH11_03270 [Jatrophihabitans sp.]|jgi:NhaA family Na+:H+ antiporter